MNASEPPPERLERMKEILKDSYPRRRDGEAPEPLPAGVLAELGGRPGRTRRAEADGTSLAGKILGVFRGPQLAAVGVAAALVLIAVVVLPWPGDRGQTMRSGDGPAAAPAVIVLSGLTGDQLDAIRASGYFRAGQLVVVPAGEEPAPVLAEYEQPNVVLVDGAAGRIVAPGAPGVSAVGIPPDANDLPSLILDLLARIPQPGAE